MIYDTRNRTNINKLADHTKLAAINWYDYCINNQIQILIYETIRTVEQQKLNVANGKSQTMKSYHLVGQALDWVLVDANGTALWNAYKTSNADKVINYAKKLGFVSGRDWGWDAPHLQYEHKGYGTDTFGKFKENGDELTMSEYNELKKMITDLQKENTELKKQLENKLDKQETREPLKYHMDDWQWMKANGITDGSNPQNYITREQVSSVLKKFEQYYTKKLS
ncbi:M15 family metallopeptidase [Lysinibacillus sp. FSL K6-4013]|uniref:M15 family metallopeptidase n=1 Tax=Lysinibacillus sp. FSL K6-4013 TaxID=2921504 RepID=UPI00315A5BA1